MEHNFDIETAKKYGILAAVIVEQLKETTLRAKTDDGSRCWVRASLDDFHNILPYATKRQIWGALKKLRDNHVIIARTDDKRCKTLSYRLR